MITAVDTNVLLDVLNPGETHTEISEMALSQARSGGSLIICEPVYSELAAHFRERAVLDQFLDDMGVQLFPSEPTVLFRAGRAWSEHLQRLPRALACPRCGATEAIRCRACGASIQSRQHVLADFLIGAHASLQSERLLTRDKGYYATYFPELALG